MKTKGNDILIKTLLFVAATALIVYFFPKEADNSYTYEKDHPWTYSLLTAPFDIPVEKDSLTRRAIMDSIDRTFEPVYYRDNEIQNTVLSEFASTLNATPTELTPTERNRLVNEVRSIYGAGIVDPATYARIREGSLPGVKMIHDNVAMSLPTSSYLSARSAYARLDSVFRDPRFRAAITATRLSEHLVPNIIPDSVETERLHNEIYQRAIVATEVVQKGERIIDKGQLVTARHYSVLRKYEEMLKERGALSRESMWLPILGQILYMAILFGTLYCYLFIFRNKYFRDNRTLCFLLIAIVAFALFAFVLSKRWVYGLWVVPFSMVPIMTLIFLDSRTAYFTHTVTVLLCSIIAPFPLEFIFMQMTAGVVAIDSLKDLSRRSQLVRTAVFVFVAYSVSFMAVELMHNGTFAAIDTAMFGWFAVNSVFISFAYILMFVVEKIFGFTSRVTLVELSDINNPLLRELSEECPGTFQHSMAVSNLASAAASRIGADVQLVRAGALYHDIGKIDNPAFFTENQHGVNPHDALSPLQSARIVIGHVTDGLRRADRAKLPSIIRQFISEHHGRGQARYFYTTYRNAHPDEDVDPAPFTYPGPNPQSRETSILMMADAVEAASRSLSDHTPAAINALVNKIIDTQISEGLHSESPLSFRDVNEIKEVFAQRLRTMFHSRISYPEAVRPVKKEETPASGAPSAEQKGGV
ncbi:MAG: HDIG domain-containing protein [Clostridium sp.]|nr:HDIG domain-containing protein [Clostridium sp.]